MLQHFFGAVAPLQQVDHVAQPAIGGAVLAAPPRGHFLAVAPMGGDAALGHVMHVLGADLDFHPLLFGAHHRGVDGTIAVALRRGDETGRGRDPSAKHRAFDGGICGWFRPRAAQSLGHVFPDSIRGHLAGACAEFIAAARFREIVEARIRHTALR